ncbi:hypothetical protein N9954_07505 [Maribacter sp.]|nr:hypothetical protein [Maribacter sp.]
MGTATLIGLSSGLLLFLVIAIYRQLHKHFESESETKTNQLLMSKENESFIKIPSELHLDAENIEARKQISVMKHKLEMFKIRNEFYE